LIVSARQTGTDDGSCMKRIVAITTLLFVTTACGSSGSTGGAVSAPTGPRVAAATPSTVAVPAEVASTLAPEVVTTPEPSGDPELDALGSELDGLEKELTALDSAANDPQGTNP